MRPTLLLILRRPRSGCPEGRATEMQHPYGFLPTNNSMVSVSGIASAEAILPS